MPKDLLHGIPIFALALVFLTALACQFVWARREPRPAADAGAQAYALRYPPRYAVLYGALFFLSAAMTVAFAVLRLDTVLFYVIAGVLAVFAAGELNGALRRRIVYAEGKFTVRPEFGGEEEVPLDAITEAGYKKSFGGETLRVYGAEGKLFEADLCYRNFRFLLATLRGAGLLPADAADAEQAPEAALPAAGDVEDPPRETP